MTDIDERKEKLKLTTKYTVKITYYPTLLYPVMFCHFILFVYNYVITTIKV